MTKKINFDKIKNLKKKKKDEKEEKIKKYQEYSEETVEKPKKKKKKRKFRIWYFLLILIIIFVIIFFLAGVGFCYYIVTSAPEFNVEKMFEKEASELYDINGNLYATLGEEQRQKISYEEIPEVLIDAIIATEDSRFFQHNGFDAPRFLKASISQVLGHGGGGASTLTMQLSKLAFTSTTDTGIQGIIRKFTDIYMSVFKMEKYFTKEDIIEYYVNTPCMGGNIYGVKQAAAYYFNKEIQDINLVEAAQLAGMFQSPNGYNPYNNPNDANDRKNTVLYLMKRHGYITQDEYDAATSVKIKDMLDNSGSTVTSKYQGFIDTVVQEVIDRTGNNPYNVPMIIYTTMDKSKQDAINNMYETYWWKDEKVEAGIAVIDSDTGDILAVGAGRNKKSAMTLNTATMSGQIKRMPGSTIKPIMDYGPAVEYAGLSQYGPYLDEPIKYGSGKIRNFNNNYIGFDTMKHCLVNSLNTCALATFRMTTNEQKYEFVESLGIDLNGIGYLPESYSIGSWNGVSPVELAAAYAAFSNGGYYHEEHSFTKLFYKETEETFEIKPVERQVMSAQTTYIISKTLTGVTPGAVQVSGTEIASKTGTTSFDDAVLKAVGLTSSVIPDAWIVSYDTNYVISLWYGYPNTLNAETAAAKEYITNSHGNTAKKEIMGMLSHAILNTGSKFKNPGGVSSIEVELDTYPPAYPSVYTPDSMRGSFLFKAGTEPSEVSTRFEKLNNPSGVSYKINNDKISLSWTSPGTPKELTDAHLRTYFDNDLYRGINGDFYEFYINRRKEQNAEILGVFGFDVYLKLDSTTKYVGFTTNTTMEIDLNEYPGYYDGVIIKGAYSNYKANASDGYTLLFQTQQSFEENEITISSKISPTLEKEQEYTEINSGNFRQYITVKYNGKDITNSVSLTAHELTNICKSSVCTYVPTSFTSELGTYNVNYSLGIVYQGKNISKSYTQKVTVKEKTN